jgi:hypothetical protein
VVRLTGVCIFAEKLVLEKGKVGGKDRRPKPEVRSFKNIRTLDCKTARPQDRKTKKRANGFALFWYPEQTKVSTG